MNNFEQFIKMLKNSRTKFVIDVEKRTHVIVGDKVFIFNSSGTLVEVL